MPELSMLPDLLDRLDRAVNEDRDTTVVALGILLLGKRFKDDLKKQKEDDPTSLILGEVGIRDPGL